MRDDPEETYFEIELLAAQAGQFPALRQGNAKRIVDLALDELRRIREARGVEPKANGKEAKR